MKYFLDPIFEFGAMTFRKVLVGARRKTIDSYERRAKHSKFSGEQLREIRRSGQARECARRRARRAA